MTRPVAALKIVLNCDSLPADIGDEEHIPSVNDSMGMDDAFRPGSDLKGPFNRISVTKHFHATTLERLNL